MRRRSKRNKTANTLRDQVGRIISAQKVVSSVLAREQPVNVDNAQELVEALKKSLPNRVYTEKYVLANYTGPSFGAPARLLKQKLPHVVVRPVSVDEVRAVLETANRYHVPVIPVCLQSTVIGGSPFRGGIIIDLTGMNRILKVDTTHGYVVVEPGVRFSDVLKRIQPLGYTLAVGTFLSSFSVIATLGLRVPLHNLTNRTWDQLLGLEVVMPDGSILRTGTLLYGEDVPLWTDVQNSFVGLKDLFRPSYGTLGIVTKAAFRIWPILDGHQVHVFAFDDFHKAFLFTHSVSKSSMTDQAMVWGWPLAGLIEFKRTARYLEYMEARANLYQEETPTSLGLPNCFAWAVARGFKEELSAFRSVCIKLAKQYKGKYIPEEEMKASFPNLWRFWSSGLIEDEWRVIPETLNVSIQFTGPVDLISRFYRKLSRELPKHGYKNWEYYTRMFHGGMTPFFRVMPLVDLEDDHAIEEFRWLRERILTLALQLGLNPMTEPFWFNSPTNPRDFVGPGSTIKRILECIRNEFDPNRIMNPAMEDYTLL